MSLGFSAISLVLFLCAIQSLQYAEAGSTYWKRIKPRKGHQNASKQLRITNGKPTPPHKYPSMVLMVIDDDPSCGATILNNEWVLSAAHCVIKEYPNEYWFYAGKHDKSKTELGEQKAMCVKVVRHEDYDDETYKNDIAMFKIFPPFKFTKFVQPVLLPTANWNKLGPATPVGWGKIGEHDPTADLLQETVVPVISNLECATMMDDVFDTTLCASSDDGKDACQGDSGGPLYYKDPVTTNYSQVGIVSWGDGCAESGKAGIYTRITKYLDWIRYTMTGRFAAGIKQPAPFQGRGIQKIAAAAKNDSDPISKGDSKPHEYPSVVLMKIYGEPSCTGTIYNSEWVLTAAHCVISLNPRDYSFFAGKQEKYRTEASQQKVACVQIVRHEKFDSESRLNDIALFKVSPPFDLSDNIKVVELAPNNWNKEGRAVPVGWARIAETAKTAGSLQNSMLDILANKECSDIMDNVFNTTICAWSLERMVPQCRGDSGGPLFYKENQKNIQIGIESTGAACAKKGNAGIYTRVSNYISWIRKTTTVKVKSGGKSSQPVLPRVKTAVIFKRRDHDGQSAAEALTDAEVEERTKSFPRIAGGGETRKHQFPSVVLMIYNGRVICSGTIIHSKWVLSAAHCVLGTSPSSFVFLAGKHKKYVAEDKEQNVTAIVIVKHAAYSNNPINNDIALFKVTPPFKLNKYVKPAKLPKPDMNPTGVATAVGWGAVHLGDSKSSNLQKIVVPIIMNDECSDIYGENQIFPGSICAGFDKGGRTACQGDSGGPLYFRTRREQIVIGVTSWGKGCAKTRHPGVYTRVTEYLAWIDEHTGLKSSKVRGH